jgi:hypothetical protein
MSPNTDATGVRFWVKYLFSADHLTFFASNSLGRLSAKVPLRRDGDSFFSGDFAIEWRLGPATPKGAAGAGGETGSSKSPAMRPEARKWSKISHETFRPEWAYVG